MLRRYSDLLVLGKPQWYDDQGVPRYCAFHPSKCGVYDIHVALMVIKCQACPATFKVASSWARHNGTSIHFPTTHDAGSFHWADPPFHQGCMGETMMSDTLSIHEFWSRNTVWERRPEFERDYPERGEEELV